MNNLINDESYTEVRNAMHDKLIAHMNNTRDLYRGYQWSLRPWQKILYRIGRMKVIQGRERMKSMNQDSWIMIQDFQWNQQSERNVRGRRRGYDGGKEIFKMV